MPGFKLLAFAAAVAAALLSGCASLYVHDQAAQESTAAARTALDQVKLDDLFASEDAYLKQLETNENALLQAQNAAQRDAEIVVFLRGGSFFDPPQSCSAIVRSRIDGYLLKIAGTSDGVGKPRLWRAVDAAYSGTLDEKAAALAFGARMKTVLDAAAPMPNVVALASPAGLTLAEALGSLNDLTAKVATDQAAVEQGKKDFTAAMKSAAASLASGATSKSQLEDLQKRINAALTDANPYLRLALTEGAAKNVQSLIDVTGASAPGADAPRLTQEAAAGLQFIQAAAGVGDAFANPPRVPHPNALAATQAWLQYVASGAQSEIAATNVKLAIAVSEVSSIAQQIYYLSKAGEALPEITRAQCDQTDGLLRVLQPVGKDTQSNKLNGAVTEALWYYAKVWNVGFLTARELHQVQDPLATRRANLRRSRDAGAAWIGTLKPGVETLAGYGAGGLDAATFARLLEALGVSAIAVGVN